jgi:hypothetical protein
MMGELVELLVLVLSGSLITTSNNLCDKVPVVYELPARIFNAGTSTITTGTVRNKEYTSSSGGCWLIRQRSLLRWHMCW